MHQVFEYPVKIRFSHCDPAGIVFHPQYFTIFNGVLEEFFQQVVRIPFMELYKHDIALPVVGVRCDFMAPARPGDECTARLWIERLGASSIRMGMTLHCGDVQVLRMAETMVCSAVKGGMRAVEVPENIRSRLMPYVREEETLAMTLRA